MMGAYTVTSESEEEVMFPGQGSPSAHGFCLSIGWQQESVQTGFDVGPTF